jgi:F-type H+-transporting ATPase subunit delta
MMSDIVAKKYVKALTKSMDEKELTATLNSLQEIVPAFSNSKFMNILNSYDVLSSQKEKLVESMVENSDEKFKNFIKLLGENGRLVEIPAITKELSKQIALQNNQYEGLLISNFEVEDKEIKDIEQNLSKKLNADIKLTNKVTDYPGIKVEVESLGIEISFSADRLKAQMAEQILSSL